MAGLIAYVLLGGADFGGGVWDFLATGPRKPLQRHAIEHAIGPVWEANHVWLIFVIVVLFTCFPSGFASLCTGLFVPLHFTLVGIILRGAAFVFRKYGVVKTGRPASPRLPNIGSPRGWGVVFGVASILAPFFLGVSFGAMTSGQLRVDARGVVFPSQTFAWLTPYSACCGLLAVTTCAYLAAVYLVRDFRRRAILAGTTTAALAGVVLMLARWEAPWFTRQLLSPDAAPIVTVGLGLFAASAWAVFRMHPRAGCVCAAGEVAVILIGWAVAHRQYMIYPDVPLLGAMAPAATLRFVLWSLLAGLSLLLPSLWWLFHVFKIQPLGSGRLRRG
jgi:cytochrome d ubiquinol oxidase subunit II